MHTMHVCGRYSGDTGRVTVKRSVAGKVRQAREAGRAEEGGRKYQEMEVTSITMYDLREEGCR